ncbi:Hypothetical predicted protein [Pelobates cultripes]|uniref:Uncharacterized protein n=1 Tax=Pelobates cultripes TaxID=61616 RepID=A0AAD1WN84_PELCU|nr:Hypothetical predicted protein [Pelobates cultripes]
MATLSQERRDTWRRYSEELCHNLIPQAPELVLERPSKDYREINSFNTSIQFPLTLQKNKQCSGFHRIRSGRGERACRLSLSPKFFPGNDSIKDCSIPMYRKQFWPETGRSVCIPNICTNTQVRLPDLDKGSLEKGYNVFPMDRCSSPLCFPPSIFTDESAGEDPQGQGTELSSRLSSMDLQTLVSPDPSVSQGNQNPTGHDSGLLSGKQRSSAQAPAVDVDRSPFYRISSWILLTHL